MEISEYDSPFRKGSQFTREVFENVAFATGKPPTYTIKVEQSEIIQGKLYQKELIKIFQQGIRLQWSWFPDNTLSSLTNFLPEHVNSEGH